MDFGEVLMPFKKNRVYLKSVPDQKGLAWIGGTTFFNTFGGCGSWCTP